MRTLRRKHETRKAARWIQAAFTAFLLGSAAFASPQADGFAERPALDPYTGGEAEVMERLGIRSFGPFPWGDGHATTTIEETLGGAPVLWIETAHFRLGSTLEPMELPSDAKAKKRLLAELGQLRKRLPNLPRRVRTLDPWLLLHLQAWRLERTYSDFVATLGLEERAGPAHPYLGQKAPFCVLLTEKVSSLARYSKTHCDLRSEGALRTSFPVSEALFFGFAFESLIGEFHSDAWLHFALVHGVVETLASGVQPYTRELPEWFRIGLAHHFARRLVDEEILLYTTPPGEAVRGPEDADFEPRVRARVANDYYPSLLEMMAWRGPEDMGFADHMMAWARVDFLLQDDAARARALLLGFGSPIPWDAPEREALIRATNEEALREVAGGDPATLDQAWASWVRATYRKR